MGTVLLALTLLVIGIAKKQPVRFWAAAAAAVLFQVATSYLFQYYTGVVTPYVKRATHDGKLMEAYAMVFMVLSWGVPALIARWGYRAGRAGATARS